MRSRGREDNRIFIDGVPVLCYNFLNDDEEE